tara:strand:- start:7765 stop:7956 length:192 start_codon:yes stop_codon:yes gene_type:complete
MSKIQEIEEFLIYRKKEYSKDINFYTERLEQDPTSRENELYLQMAESGILFVEEMGNKFFNWE